MGTFTSPIPVWRTGLSLININMNRFSQAKIAEMRNAFQLFDRDGDGTINAKELGSVMKTMGMQPSEDSLARMIKIADTDGGGVVEFQEFMEMICDQMEVSDEEIEEAFKMFDRDNSGTINHNEVKHVVTKLGMKMTDEQIADMIKIADKDGDGDVNYLEFMRLMKK